MSRSVLCTLVMMGVISWCTNASAAATFRWSATPADNNWNNSTNWSIIGGGADAGLDGIPNGTDTAYLDGASTQTSINIPAPLTVNNITWLYNDGAGTFSLTGSALDVNTLRKDRNGTFTINNDIDLSLGNTSLNNGGGTGTVEAKGTASGTGRLLPTGGLSTRTIEIFGDNTNTGAFQMGGNTNVILRHLNALGLTTGLMQVTSGSPTFSLATDANYGGQLRLTGGSTVLNLKIVDSGASDRTLTFRGGTTNHGGDINFVANEVGSTGDLTLRWLKADAGTQSVQEEISTLSNSVVQLDTTLGTSIIQLITSAVISGDGNLLKTGLGTGEVELAQTYTGGTQISGGTLQLHAAGGLPDTGAVNIASGATFDLNDLSDTIGSLTGEGDVDLGATPGNTLTLSEGILPGNSPGSLTINELGEVVLGGSSVNTFELDSLAGPNDQVVFSGAANLTLGGTLNIVDLGGLDDGGYVLFDMNGGTISGGFSDIVLPFGFTGVINTSSGDVVLDVVFSIPEPNSLTLLLMAGMIAGAVRKRSRGLRSVKFS